VPDDGVGVGGQFDAAEDDDKGHAPNVLWIGIGVGVGVDE